MKKKSLSQYICMDLPEGGIEPVGVVSVTFSGEGQIVVSNTTVLKCKIVEGNLVYMYPIQKSHLCALSINHTFML